MSKLFCNIAVSLVLTAGTSYAESMHSYVLVGTRASDEAVEFIDTGSIEKSADAPTAWMLLFNPEPIFVGGRRVEYGLYQYRYFCHRHMTQILYGAVYSGDGNPLSTDDSAGKPQPVVPESLEETAFALVCENRLPFAEVPSFDEQTKALAFARKLSARLQSKKVEHK